MTKTPAAQVYLQLPDGPDRDALRAGLLALQCIPVNLSPPGPALHEQLQALSLDPHALVFLDVSNALPKVTHRFERILKTWPQALRARTLLTRLAAGHVSAADRTWVQSAGFVDLLPSLQGHAPTSTLRRALDLVAATVGLPALAADELDRYLRAVPGSSAGQSPRALIRAHTGLEAEALADLLQLKLDIRDRSYRFKPYPACFIGAAAVAWIGPHFGLDSARVVAVGQALQALDLLYHVAHEQAFANAELFFRLRAPADLPLVDLAVALQHLRKVLVVMDRSHRGKVYPNCWIGQEAVDVLCAQHSITRVHSQLVLHRLLQFGCFEHVVSEHGFIDGHFFYRFSGSAA